MSVRIRGSLNVLTGHQSKVLLPLYEFSSLFQLRLASTMCASQSLFRSVLYSSRIGNGYKLKLGCFPNGKYFTSSLGLPASRNCALPVSSAAIVEEASEPHRLGRS